MHKYIILLFISGLIFTGCISNVNNETVEELANIAYEINVSTDIDSYSMFMSSVPGMPINIDANIYDENANLQLVISTDKGHLLLWENQGKIINLKNEYICPFEDKTVYWSPLNENDKEVIEEATVLIKILDENLNEITSTYIGTITLIDDTNYMIDYDIE